MKKRMLVLAMVVMVTFTGCGNSKESNSMTYDSAASESFTESWDGGFVTTENEISAEGTASEDMPEVEQPYEQKLIRTYDYSFETLEFDASMAYVEQKVAEYGGYIESSETSGNTHRYATLTLRIPKKKSDSFLKEVGEIGEIIYKSSSTEDVTLNYYDTTARLESLNTQHERLLSLLENAMSLEDVVALEAQLSEVEYEINRYTTMLRVYDNKIDYTTIRLSIREVEQIQVVEDDSFWMQIKKGFSGNTATVVNGLMDFVIFLITGIPFFLVIGVVAVILFFVVKKIKKSSEKKAKIRMEQAQRTYQNHVEPSDQDIKK